MGDPTSGVVAPAALLEASPQGEPVVGDPVDLPHHIYLTLLNRDGTDASSFHFTTPTTLLFGSAEDCDVRILRKGVKDQHCSLVIDHTNIRLVPHEKALVNINTDPVREDTGCFLEDDDLVSICHRIFRINIVDPADDSFREKFDVQSDFQNNSNVNYTSPIRPTFSPVGGGDNPVTPSSSSPIPRVSSASLTPPVYLASPPTPPHPAKANRVTSKAGSKRHKGQKAPKTSSSSSPSHSPAATNAVPTSTTQSPSVQQQPSLQDEQQEDTIIQNEKEKEKEKGKGKKTRKRVKQKKSPPQSPSHQPPSPSSRHLLNAQPPLDEAQPKDQPQAQAQTQTQTKKQKPNVFVITKQASTLQWRPKVPQTPTSPLPDSSLTSSPSASSSSPTHTQTTHLEEDTTNDVTAAPKKTDKATTTKAKKAERVNRSSDDEPLAMNNRTSSAQKQPPTDDINLSKRKMDEIAFLQWNNRHMSNTSSVRSRKQTAFLRPEDEKKKPSYSRPSRTTSNGNAADDDNDEEVDITSPEGESPHKVVPSSTRSPSKSSVFSPPRPLATKSPRQRNRQRNLLIAPDSSPSPVPSPDIKEEPIEDGAPTSKGGKKQKERLVKRILGLMDSILAELDEDGELKCADFLHNPEKASFANPSAWATYKKVVKSPICLEDIQNNINEYTSVQELTKDFNKLLQNSKKLISHNIFTVNHVDWLEKLFANWVESAS